MSKINYQELREAAEQATQDEWVAYILPGHNGIYPARTSEGRHCGYFIDWPGVCQGRESISIRTYAVNCNDAWLNTEGDDISGSYVKYKDHQEVVAALEAKCAALAAENAWLKSGAMDEIKVINRGGQAYCVKDGVQVNPMYARGWNDYRAKSMQSDTPATDAFLAEVRAQGVEMFAECAYTLEHHDHAVAFAAELRKGGNQ
ncbi:ead/Ea22-like family protein [Escherichia coli]|nr:ead/Ea22-like family protein [Escherichia coli]